MPEQENVTVSDVLKTAEKAIKFPLRFRFTTSELRVETAVVNSVEEYMKHASKRKVPVEDAANGLARRTGIDTSRAHISKVKLE